MGLNLLGRAGAGIFIGNLLQDGPSRPAAAAPPPPRGGPRPGLRGLRGRRRRQAQEEAADRREEARGGLQDAVEARRLAADALHGEARRQTSYLLCRRLSFSYSLYLSLSLSLSFSPGLSPSLSAAALRALFSIVVRRAQGLFLVVALWPFLRTSAPRRPQLSLSPFSLSRP